MCLCKVYILYTPLCLLYKHTHTDHDYANVFIYKIALFNDDDDATMTPTATTSTRHTLSAISLDISVIRNTETCPLRVVVAWRTFRDNIISVEMRCARSSHFGFLWFGAHRRSHANDVITDHDHTHSAMYVCVDEVFQKSIQVLINIPCIFDRSASEFPSPSCTRVHTIWMVTHTSSVQRRRAPTEPQHTLAHTKSRE